MKSHTLRTISVLLTLCMLLSLTSPGPVVFGQSILLDNTETTEETSTSTDSSESEATEPSESESTEPSEGESTEPSEGESTEPSEGESTEPSEGESTEPSEGESTEPSEGESTDPSEGEPTDPSEGESTEPSEGESTEPSEDNGDKEAPVFGDLARNPEQWAKEAEYTFSITDASSLTVTVVTPSGLTLSLSPDESGVYRFIAETNGTYQLIATDEAGNSSNYEITETQIDIDPPIISPPVRDKEGWVQQSAYSFAVTEASNITVAVTDPAGNSTEIFADADGFYWVTVASNGTYTILVTDEAGNTANVTIEETEIDTDLPVISTPLRDKEGWTNQAEYNFTISDIDAVTVTLRYPNGDTQELSAITGTYSFLAEASGTYVITVTDGAGNTAFVEVLEAEIDSNEPVIATPVRDHIGWRQETAYHITVTDIASGIVSVVAVYPNGETMELVANELGYFLAVSENGIHKIIATDAVGNTATLELTESNIDRDAPTVGSLTRKETGWNQSAQYDFAAADSAAPIASVSVTHPDGTVAELQGNKGTYSFVVSVNGKYVITVADEAGNIATLSFDEDMIDLTLPEITEPIRSQAGWSQQVSYSFQVSDNSTEIAAVTLTTPHGDTLNLAPGQNGSYSFLVNENGSYTVTARDSAGNVATWEISEKYIDLEAPVIETPVRQEDGWEQKTDYIFTASDAASGIYSVYIQAEGGIREALIADENENYLFTVRDNLVYTITVIDNVGNQATIAVAENHIDLNPPVIQTPSREHADWQPETTYSFLAEDLESSIVSVFLRFNGMETALTPDENGIYSFLVNENGTYTIIATDEAQNVAEITVEETHIDYTNPTIEWHRVDIIWATQREYTFTIQDNLSGVNNVTVQFNDEEAVVLTVGEDGVTYSFTALINGTYLITVTDKAGNSSEFTLVEDRIDRTAPSIDQPIRNPEGWQQEVEYSFQATDIGAGIQEVSVAFGADVLVLTPDTEGIYRFVVTANGNYVITAIDAVGNTSTISVSEVCIDRTAPVIEPPLRNKEGWQQQAIYRFNAFDSESGIVGVTVRTQQGENVSVSSLDDGLYSFTATMNTAYIITVVDVAGNKTEWTVTEEYIDVIAPTISRHEFDTDGQWLYEREYVVSVIDDLAGIASVTVSFNGGEPMTLMYQSYLNGYGFTALENGIYVVVATDIAGNIAVLEIVEDHVDYTAPEITDPERQESGWQQKVNYSFSLSDVQSGIERVIVRSPKGLLVKLTASGNDYSFVVDMNGQYTITVTDIVGNMTILYLDESHIDTTVADIQQLAYPTDGQWLTERLYGFTITDTQSGIASVVLSQTGKEDLLLDSQKDGTYQFVAYDNTAYTITVTDNVGNVTTITVTEELLDQTGPQIDKPNRGETGWQQDTFYTFTVSDAAVGMDMVKVMIGDKTVSLEKIDEITYRVPVALNGVYVIIAVDKLGNESQLTLTEDHIDITVPGFSDIQTQQEWDHDRNWAAITVTDNTSLAAVIITDADNQSLTFTVDGSRYFLDIPRNGTYTITATDEAGNVSVTTFVIDHIDDTEPTEPVLNANGTGLWVNVDVSMTASAKDTQSGIHAYWYSTTTDVFSKDRWQRMELKDDIGYMTLTDDQDLIYYVVAEDGVGRISTVSQIQVKIDKTPAQDLTASLSTQEGSGYLKMVNGVALYLDQVLFTAQASDSASGIVRYEYRITGDAGSDTGWISMEAGAEGIKQIFRDVEDIYTVHVRVYDLAGNCSAEFSTKPFILELTHGEDKEPAPHIEMNISAGTYTGIWTKDTVTIIVTGSMSVSGIDFYEYRVDYADPAIPDTAWTRISNTPDKAILSVGKDTNAVYYFRAVSFAGNRSLETSRTVKVQKTSPDAAVFSLQEATGTNGWHTDYPDYQVVLTERDSFLAPVIYTIRYSHNGGTEKVLEYDGTNLPAINLDGNWNFEITTTDAAGNISRLDASQFNINIDTLAPDHVDVLLNDTTILVNGNGTPTLNEVNILNLVKPVDFTIFRSAAVKVSATAQGGTSGLLGIYYQIVAEHDQYSTAGVWEPLTENGIELAPDGKYRLYFKAVDVAGNITYFNGENIILDATAASSTMMPSSENQSSHGFYYADATLNLSVQDPAIGEYAAFAGLASIRYQIICDGFMTQEGQLWPGSGTVKEQQGRVISWEGSVRIDAALNNSNNIAVKVLVTDIAGNTSTLSMNEGVIKIDTTTPVVSGSYDTNAPAAMIHKTAAFTGSRTLTLTVLEKNFVAGESLVWVTDADTGKTLTYKWVSDGQIHTATIPVTEDGCYTIGISIKDAAGNTESKILFEQGTISAEAFIIDNTASQIQVSYDNNDALNEMYFDAERTVTVIVTERNFNPDNISAALKAVYSDGTESTVKLSDWHSDGNNHTATMTIDKDAVYYLDVSGTDALGNAAEETIYNGTAPQHWVLDTAMDVPSIQHVVNNTAYNGSIVPEITILDPNIDQIILKLIRTRMYEINVDVTDILLTEEKVIYTDIEGGQKVSLDIFPLEKGMDGEYLLSVQAIDKAGNSAENSVRFYTNRYGSIYVYDQALTDIMDGYHQKIDQDITITEYNPSGIKDGSAVVHITVDGVPISAPVFTTSPVENSESGWYEYIHVISKGNFARDGVYEVVLSTKDTAGNVPENTAENLAIRFAVDTTIPELPSIIGMEEGIVKADSVTVTLSAMDNVSLESITVYLNGKVLEQWVGIDSYSSEKSFAIPAGLEHTIRLVVVDKAGNVLDTADGSFAPGYDFHDTITVSTNFFLRLYANRVLFYSSIAGVAAVLIGGAILIVVMAKKKKAKKPTTDTTSETN